MSNHQFTRPEGTGGKSILGSDDKTPLNQLEKNALGNLDEDKLNDLAKCLFTLNNRRYGPIPGAYMVMCTKPCLLYTSPSPRDGLLSRMPSSA
mgnify:CR=1 FL=1